MKNYKNYFEGDNSCNLMEKFSIEKRNGLGQEVEDVWNDLKSKQNLTMGSRNGEKQTQRTFKSSLNTLKSMGVKFSS
jgi:hypothetical protein